MSICFKYVLIFIYISTLTFFHLYVYLCEINELLYTFIMNKLDVLESNYDYIIVGAGSAGTVLALRLSEDQNTSVLLLEAGGYGGKLLDIPIVGPLLQHTIYDWKYKTVPQANACGALESNVSLWPMGKIFGGSTKLNNMMYTRGDPEDYKRWYRDLPDYDYEKDVLSFFKKAENQVGSFIYDDKYHSTKGPLISNDLPYKSELSKLAMEAAKELNFPIRDINGMHNTGFHYPQVNVRDGTRYTTAHHLLRNKRPNLTIRTHSTVQEVLLRSEFEAYGVKFISIGKEFIATARKGVVLSAGTVGTPKILMLSGIGIAGHLKSVGIEPKVNLPVGNNLQDHVGTGFDLVTINRSLDINFAQLASPYSVFQYMFASEGPYTLTGCEALGVIRTDCLNNIRCDTTSSPDLEILFLPLTVTSDYGTHLRKVVGINDETWKGYFDDLTNKHTINIFPVMLHPRSRGTVRLRSNDPGESPVIDPNYLSDPYDVKMLKRGVGFVKALIGTEAFRKVGAEVYDKVIPGCERETFDTDAYWECYVRRVTMTVYHPVGTCRMGGGDREGTVVGYDFKVIGTNKLFVVDASVIPELVSANINAAVVMLAERAASVIKYHEYLQKGVCSAKEIFVQKIFC